MYRPPAFDVTDRSDLRDLVNAIGVAHLVTAGPTGFDASFVPLLLDHDDGHDVLVGHLARANPQWRHVRPGDGALAIFSGPDAYVSPSAYPARTGHGRVVPTWNYVAVHAHGELVVHDDRDWTADLVRRLTAHHEAGRDDPWSPDEAPAAFVEANLAEIVGIEVRLTRLEGKRKLSQNRTPADAAAVRVALAAGTAAEREVARWMAPPP